MWYYLVALLVCCRWIIWIAWHQFISRATKPEAMVWINSINIRVRMLWEGT